MESLVFSVETGRRRGLFDLTPQIKSWLAGRSDGLVSVFVPHATAGIVILETGAGSDDDFLDAIDEVLPRDDRWRHSHGSFGHGADHVLPGFISPSVTIPVFDGVMALGTWQSVMLVDPNEDNRVRRIRLSWIPA